MKYLLLALLALLVLWQWRTRRGSQGRSQGRAVNEPPKPVEMVACDQCGLHVATNDAVQGRLGSYCSAAHRQRHEA